MSPMHLARSGKLDQDGRPGLVGMAIEPIRTQRRRVVRFAQICRLPSLATIDIEAGSAESTVRRASM